MKTYAVTLSLTRAGKANIIGRIKVLRRAVPSLGLKYAKEFVEYHWGNPRDEDNYKRDLPLTVRMTEPQLGRLMIADKLYMGTMNSSEPMFNIQKVVEQTEFVDLSSYDEESE